MRVSEQIDAMEVSNTNPINFLIIPRVFAAIIMIPILTLYADALSIIGLVGCYKGFNAGRGTESVGIAANSAVVTASLLLIIVDLIAVQITDLL